MALTPLLVASFAFNFNNFNNIYLLTGGGPAMEGSSVAGATDILISYTYKIAFAAGKGNDFGLASAISIIIFLIVGHHLGDLVRTIQGTERGALMSAVAAPAPPMPKARRRTFRRLVPGAADGVTSSRGSPSPARSSRCCGSSARPSRRTRRSAAARSSRPSPTLENFETLFNNPDQPYANWYVNTMIVATVSAFFTVLIAAGAAYAFSRFRFKGRKVGLMFLLLVQMFPQFLSLTAIYIIMVNIGDVFPPIGLDTLSGLILVYLGGAMGVNAWLIKGFFDTIPMEIDESAKVDGATHGQVFWGIILPLAVPGPRGRRPAELHRHDQRVHHRQRPASRRRRRRPWPSACRASSRTRTRRTGGRSPPAPCSPRSRS